MCARYKLSVAGAVVQRELLVYIPKDIPPRSNIAPTQNVLGVVAGPEGRVAKDFRWGLVPSWADDPSIGQRLINARVETAAEKPSFRRALKKQRCAIPASGFYEWREVAPDAEADLFGEPAAKKPKPYKQPYLFSLRDREVFAFAGLYESWRQPDGELLETCTILTTTPNRLLGEFHDRMPCILRPDDVEAWLSPTERTEELMPLLTPYEDKAMRSDIADRALNNARYEPGT